MLYRRCMTMLRSSARLLWAGTIACPCWRMVVVAGEMKPPGASVAVLTPSPTAQTGPEVCQAATWASSSSSKSAIYFAFGLNNSSSLCKRRSRQPSMLKYSRLSLDLNLSFVPHWSLWSRFRERPRFWSKPLLVDALRHLGGVVVPSSVPHSSFLAI